MQLIPGAGVGGRLPWLLCKPSLHLSPLVRDSFQRLSKTVTVTPPPTPDTHRWLWDTPRASISIFFIDGKNLCQFFFSELLGSDQVPRTQKPDESCMFTQIIHTWREAACDSSETLAKFWKGAAS